MASIEIDFQRSMQQANQIEELASELKVSVKNDYSSALNQLNAGWQSDYSGEYLKKAEELRRQLLVSSANIEKIAQNIRITAKRIYEAEKRAEEIAKERAAHG